MVLVLGILLAQGCSNNVRPDLGLLYGNASSSEIPPIILVHGVMGARLCESQSGKEIWPGGLLKILFSNYEDVALKIDPGNLEPRLSELKTCGITDKTAGHDFYESILQTLEQAGGYTAGTLGVQAKRGARRHYTLVYDWRYDNLQAVKALDELIEGIRADYNDPNLKVDVIAHSMGGMITRYFLRYGTTDVLNNNEFPLNPH